MLAHILLIPELFHKARIQLSSDLFHAGSEMYLKMTWQSVLTATEKWGTDFLHNPRHAWSVIELTARSYWAANSNNLPAEVGDKIFSRDMSSPGILFWIYTEVADNGVQLQIGIDLLLRFLRERTVHDVLAKAVTDSAGSTIDNIDELIQNMKDRISAVAQVTTSPVESAFPADWHPVLPDKVPTNVPFLDTFLNGGHVAGETYGLLGGYGSGKSTLAVQLLGAVGWIEQDKRIADPNYVEGECYLFHWEDTSDNYRIRLLSNLAQIERDHIEQWVKELHHLNNPPTRGDLSYRGGHLHAYEMDRYREDVHREGVANVNGEYERIVELLPRLRERNIHFIDMSGTGADPKRGSGYIKEMSQFIADDLRARNKADGKQHHVAVVIIDYAGICAKRHLRMNNLHETELRHLVGEFGDNCMRLIAKPFMTPVWVMHQLAADAQKRTAASQQHYSDAAESKSFAENMWFCFALGTLDPIHQVTQFTVSKARRTKLGPAPRVKINGSLSTMIDVTDKYTMGIHGRVAPVELVNRVNATVTSSEAPPAQQYPAGGINGSNLNEGGGN